MNSFSHIDEKGNAVMVDVSHKSETQRTASAAGRIAMSPACYGAVRNQAVPKGDVLGAARIAAIMAAKKTSDLIPLCHIVPLSACTVDFVFHDDTYEIECRASAACTGRTGVEMEALTAVSAALLTIYDMCKAIDKRMVMGGIHLVEKKGGKSGDFLFDGEKS